MKFILPVLMLLLGSVSFAQNQFQPDKFWQDIPEKELENVNLERRIVPLVYRTMQLETQSLSASLSNAPLRDMTISQQSDLIIPVPMPDGSLQHFRIFYTPLMPDKLADKYPMIRTYSGNGIEDPTAYIKCDITQFGFHAMIRSASQGSVFLDPYFYGDDRYYISYYKKDFQKSHFWDCSFDKVNNTQPVEETSGGNRFAGDCNFRTYTLALACTGEYAAFHGGTVAGVMAAYNTSMNRVNGVFELDCSLTMVLHPNTDTLIFLNAATDPYTNGNGGTMLGENITTCNARIGSANYDIGHVFSTGGGGVAYLGSVCGSSKAGGVTGSGSPVGDAFDIDYVAHEMGHQYGGNHTQNNNCNRNNSTAMEPGSASTIMGYAGICNPNVQNNSDAYYHAISLQEIGNFTTGGGNSCATTTNPPNSPPTANAGSDYTVPKSTPLVLTGSTTDPDGLSGLTYCWEQMDNAVATMPPVATNTGGPAFRSLTPVAVNFRYLPALSAVVANTTPTWEVLPSVARTMNWRFTVRDNADPGGCTEEDNMVITVNGTAGPFLVTAPNTAVTWNVGENQTVTWNVAGTTSAPVSCANVKITLSLDGGFTYPVTLIASTANDGSETIVVPNNPTTQARVRVESVGNIFYDISNSNFTIVATVPDFALDATPASQQICSPSNAVYTVSITSILGFNTPVSLSVSGMPPGLQSNFSNNPVTPTANSILTFSNTGSVTPGTYSITVTGTAGAIVKTKIISLTVLNGSIGNVTLSVPTNGATGVSLTPNFSWTGGAGATAFQLDVATDISFSNIVFTNNTITASPYTIATLLTASTTYYWRVRGINTCGNGNFSSVFSFTTAAITCNNYASTNVPVNISASGTPTINSTLVIPITGNIIDVNVTNLNITHTWTEDLVIRLTSPTGTVVELVNAVCGDNNNMNLNFDSQAANPYSAIPCPAVGGGTYQPLQTLNAYNGQAANGTWTLTVLDQANQDGGSLNSWGLTICVESAVPLTLSTTVTNLSCNGAQNGSITVNASGGTPPYQFSLNGGTYQSSGTFNGLAAGTYSVTVRDNVNSTSSTSVTITQPPALVITPSSSNVTCNGANNGSATVSVTGGVPSYTFLWSNNATTSTISGLPAGNYICTVTDANSCTKTQAFAITQPAAIVITPSFSNVSCNGGNNGSATVSVSGGQAPFSYLWNNNATTATISNIAAGNYSCTVTDANNCTQVQAVTVSQPAPINTSVNTVNIFCNGGNNGSVTVMANGGNTPYTYLWSNNATTATINNLTAGTYTCTITDNSSCTVSQSATITQPAPINTSATTVNVFCNGGNNGSATVSVIGGNAPFSYVWSNNATTATINNLIAGNYICTVTDNNNCTKTQTVNITQPAPMNTSATSVNVFCNGGNNGSASVSVNGGNSPYSYLWNNNATTPTINNLVAGTYICTITDNNNCTKSQSVTISQPPPINTSGSSVNVNCNGASNGSATVVASGGNTPFTYLWNNNATTATINNLTAGTYICTVTDNNNCTKSQVVTVTQPAPVAVNINASNVSCNGLNDGSASAVASGGNAPYTYLWNNNATTPTINNLSAGIYTCTVSDINNCTKTQSVTITQAAPVVAAVNGANITCNGASNGSATVTPSGGNAPYTYVWNNNATSQTLNGLSAGTYTCTVYDSNLCTATQSVTITQPAPLLSNANSTNVTCNGGNNGSATVSASGGTAPYSYLWNNNATTATINSIAAGNYSCTITDANNCTKVQTVSISQPSPVNATTNVGNISCNGNNNGSASLTVSGGVTPYTYLWSNNATTAAISNLSAGTFGFTITDGNGCIENGSVNVTQPAVLVVTGSSNNIACNSSAGGSASVMVSGGTSPYNYLWNNNATTASISSLAAGNYSCTVTDNNGCTQSESFVITASASLNVDAVTNNISCNGSANGSINLNVSGGATPYTYLWNTNATTSSLNNLGAGTYTCTVTDVNGCTGLETVVISQPAVLSVASQSTNINCNGAANGSAMVMVNGGSTPYMYLWSNNATTAQVTGLAPGNYSCTVTDNNGCTQVQSFVITQPTAINTSFTGEDISCFGFNDGNAIVNVNGGTAPYAYLWNNNATNPVLNNLTAGTYICTVSDNNGCTKTGSIAISQPNALNAGIAGNDISCNGVSDGFAVMTVSGGVQPYQYEWNNDVTFPTVNNLSAGTYDCTATDDNGCTIVASVSIEEPELLLAAANATNVTCGSTSNGTASVTVSGGTGPFTYLWNNNQTTSAISGLIAGNYMCTVTDNNGCSDETMVTILQTSELAVSATSTPVICQGDANATISVTAFGGSAIYSYLWNNNETAPVITQLEAGTYSCTVSDNAGCTGEVAVEIESPALLTAFANTEDITCFGAADGQAAVSVDGGVLPYTYLWSNNAIDSYLTTLSAGVYTCTVTDHNGCTLVQTMQVDEPSQLDVSVSSVDVTCFGQSDGTATVLASGGTAPYTYYWITTETSPSIFGLDAGDYNVQVTDLNGCVMFAIAQVAEPDAIVLTTTASDVNCFNGNDGAAQISTEGGTPPYSYLWNTNATTSGIENLVPGDYICTVTDDNNCQETAALVIAQPDELIVQLTGDNGAPGNNDGTAEINILGGVPAYSFVWSNGATGADISGLAPGVYTVTATDNDDCDIPGSITISDAEVIIYCNAYGENSDKEWIDQVNLGTFTNTSGNNGGYGDFTNVATSLYEGETVSVNLVPGYDAQTYPEYWRIYVDLNIDGDFFDTGELLAEGQAEGVLNLNFTVPEINTPGDTRLRITMSRDLPGFYCELFPLGEVEDYSVKISNVPNSISDQFPGINSETLTLTPNPASDVAILTFSADIGGQTTLKLTDELGRTLSQREIRYMQGMNETLISLEALPAGMYFVSLQSSTSNLTKKLVVVK